MTKSLTPLALIAALGACEADLEAPVETPGGSPGGKADAGTSVIDDYRYRIRGRGFLDAPAGRFPAMDTSRFGSWAGSHTWLRDPVTIDQPMVAGDELSLPALSGGRKVYLLPVSGEAMEEVLIEAEDGDGQPVDIALLADDEVFIFASVTPGGSLKLRLPYTGDYILSVRPKYGQAPRLRRTRLTPCEEIGFCNGQFDEEPEPVMEFKCGPSSLALSRDGEHIAAALYADSECKPRGLYFGQGLRLDNPYPVIGGHLRNLDISDDGQHVVGTTGGFVFLYTRDGPRSPHDSIFGGPNGQTDTAKFAPSDNRVATVGRTPPHFAAGAYFGTVDDPYATPIAGSGGQLGEALAWDATGERIAMKHHAVLIADAESAEVTQSIYLSPPARVVSFAFDPVVNRLFVLRDHPEDNVADLVSIDLDTETYAVVDSHFPVAGGLDISDDGTLMYVHTYSETRIYRPGESAPFAILPFRGEFSGDFQTVLLADYASRTIVRGQIDF